MAPHMPLDTVSTQQCESFLSKAPGQEGAPRYRVAHGLQNDTHKPKHSLQMGFVWPTWHLSFFLFKLLPTFKNHISHQNTNFLLLLKSSNIWQP